jgi:hypothetical protein
VTSRIYSAFIVRQESPQKKGASLCDGLTQLAPESGSGLPQIAVRTNTTHVPYNDFGGGCNVTAREHYMCAPSNKDRLNLDIASG